MPEDQHSHYGMGHYNHGYCILLHHPIDKLINDQLVVVVFFILHNSIKIQSGSEAILHTGN